MSNLKNYLAMKTLILASLISLTTSLFSKAQFDDKFYFPYKEWKSVENIEFDEYNFTIDNDTLNAVLFKPVNTPKGTILFYHGAGGNITYYLSIIDPLVIFPPAP